MSTSELEYLFGMAGAVVFAVTAVLAETPRGIDLFGVCVTGLITAIGGGTMRDLVLGVPVFRPSELNYTWVALFASLLAYPANRIMKHQWLACSKGAPGTMVALLASVARRMGGK